MKNILMILVLPLLATYNHGQQALFYDQGKRTSLSDQEKADLITSLNTTTTLGFWFIQPSAHKNSDF